MTETLLHTTASNNSARMTADDTSELRCSVRHIAESYYGRDGLWLCDAFEAINAEWFGSVLPYPLITVEITPHGGCLGLTASSEEPPRIKIHPTLFGLRRRGEPTPWRVNPDWLGQRYAFDVLLHEMMHVSVNYILPVKMGVGESSHNNPAWIHEVNRIAPLIGYNDVKAEGSKIQRMAVPGEFTKTGKPKKKPTRTTNGNVPYQAVYGFPHSLRRHRGDAESYYTSGSLPLDV